ncbi:hypothetical protein PITC_062010 [Penicillium italicum]|uniref:Uncharacterized protein n=1 Tax=Penicillium italicum TaxID=40296 RepID=A0A0A2L195_PENIT|nr:hypothetical protein PITC_062010 [Penicillium italicum]
MENVPQADIRSRDVAEIDRLDQYQDSPSVPSASVPAELPADPASLPPRQTKSGVRSFMDTFTDSNGSPGMRRKYRAARVYCYPTEKFTWGSYKLAAVYEFLLRTVVLGLCWRGLWWMPCDIPVLSYENFLIFVRSLFCGGSSVDDTEWFFL